MKKLCISILVSRLEYQEYIPLYIYSALRSYKDYFIMRAAIENIFPVEVWEHKSREFLRTGCISLDFSYKYLFQASIHLTNSVWLGCIIVYCPWIRFPHDLIETQ